MTGRGSTFDRSMKAEIMAKRKHPKPSAVLFDHGPGRQEIILRLVGAGFVQSVVEPGKWWVKGYPPKMVSEEEALRMAEGKA